MITETAENDNEKSTNALKCNERTHVVKDETTEEYSIPAESEGADVEQSSSAASKLEKPGPDGLETDPNELKPGPDELKTDPDELKTDSDELKTDPDELETDPSELKSGPDELKTDSDELEADPDELKTDPDELETGPSELKPGSDELKTDPDELKPKPPEAVLPAAATAVSDNFPATENGAAGEKLSSRVQIRNLPPYLKYKQVKELLSKQLSKFVVRNIRHVGMTVFFSVATPAEAATAVDIFDGFQMKGRVLRAKIAGAEPPRPKPLPPPSSNGGEQTNRTARERVTPLADKPYSEQLEIKMADVKRITANFLKNLISARVKNASEMTVQSLIEPIRPSPRIIEYRNKCEFTVGRDNDENICVGFVGGRFAANQHFIVPVDTCDNISTHMKRVVKAFEKFVVESGEPPFNEFERKGVWKMLSVREFGCDVMMIVTIFPMDESREREKALIEAVRERFLRLSNLSDENSLFRITSLYWQRLANASDPVIYEHIGGAPYVYETILDARFRVSPSSFFQTNSSGAAVLYKTIAEKCGLCKVNDVTIAQSVTNDNTVTIISEKDLEECAEERNDEPEIKKIKLEKVVATIDEQQSNLILDVCCGTGTIGISLMKLAKAVTRKFLLGVEIIPEAVEDAKVNANDNDLPSDCYKFVTGKAENVFNRMERLIPSWINLKTANVVAIIDPPRAGIHEKVVIGCRALTQLKRIIFVSCSPSLAMKNMVDLCRPTSRKFEGEPFRLTSITPVDMFPQTSHCEWVVQLDR